MKKMVAVTLILAISGCAMQINPERNPNYSLIDPKGVSLSLYDNDYRECAQLANQTDVAKASMEGALAGALVGALLGAAVGNHHTANFGAAYGGASLGGAAGVNAKQEQDSALRKCLAGRGYRVIR